MMLDPAVWVPFVDWLNERTSDSDKRPWEERGLKPDAPPEALEAYEKFLALTKEAKRKGVFA